MGRRDGKTDYNTDYQCTACHAGGVDRSEGGEVGLEISPSCRLIRNIHVDKKQYLMIIYQTTMSIVLSYNVRIPLIEP